MQADPDRVAALEARVREFEARIARLEQAGAARSSVVGTPATALEPPPGPAPLAPAPPPPAAPTPAPWVRPAQGPAPASLAAAGVQAGAAWGERTRTADGPSSASSIGGALTTGTTLRDLEERFAGRALAIVGGFALVAAAIFFLSLAFSRGWITEPMRVVIAVSVGAIAFAVGAWRLERHDRLLGTVLAGVGIGILEVALFAATSLYSLLPAEVGLVGALLLAAVAALVAVRFDARVVAAYGLVAALVAPPLVGAEPTLLTLAFLAIVLVGTTAIALFRTWSWLPPIAFLLTAPQLGSWIAGDPDTAPALVAVAGFWLVNLVAAAGEEVRVRRDALRPSSAGLVVANAAFLLGAGLVLLSGSLEPWRGVFVLAAAVAHVAVGAWFLDRQGREHLFGNLVAFTGAALVAIAALVQLDEAVLAGAWAAEAVALAWLAVRRRHRWSALAAATMLALALAQVALQYLVTAFDSGPRSVPNDELFALAVVLVASAAAGWLVAIRWVRSLLVAAAVAITAWAVLFEADGALMIGLWAALLPLAMGADRVLAGLHEDRELRTSWRLSIPEVGRVSPAALAGMLAWAAAAGTALADQLNPMDWGSAVPPAVPLTDERALIAAALTATMILAGAIAEAQVLRRAAAIIAIVVVALSAPFELGADLVVVAWTGLAVASVAYVRWDRPASVPMTCLAGALVAAAAVVALAVVAPPARLVVVDPLVAARSPLLPLWPLSFTALAAILLASPLHPPIARWATSSRLAGGAVAVYGVSIGVVAGFQRLAGGPVPLEELAAQAQVALSVTWTMIGVVALGAGLATRRSLLRHAGLGLLALATAKVFLVDLAAMDVAYRAVVLAGLGLLLLVGAWVVNRDRGPRPGDVEGVPDADAASSPTPP